MLFFSTRGCRRLPQAAAGCHRLPQAATGCRRLPQAAAGCHRLPQAAAGCQQAAAGCQQAATGCKQAANRLQTVKLTCTLAGAGLSLPSERTDTSSSASEGSVSASELPSSASPRVSMEPGGLRLRLLERVLRRPEGSSEEGGVALISPGVLANSLKMLARGVPWLAATLGPGAPVLAGVPGLGL